MKKYILLIFCTIVFSLFILNFVSPFNLNNTQLGFSSNSTTISYNPYLVNSSYASFGGGSYDNIIKFGSGNYNPPATSATISMWFSTPNATYVNTVPNSGWDGLAYSPFNCRWGINIWTGGNVSVYTVNSSQANCAGTASITNITVTDGKWHNIIYQSNITTGNVTLIVDNISNTYHIGTFGSGDTQIYFQSNPDSGGYVGYIDEYRAYNRILNSSEISQIYSNGNSNYNISLVNSSLLNYFNMNENGGTTLIDRMNNYNGSYTNMKWYNYPNNITVVNFTNAFILWNNGTIIYPFNTTGYGNYTGNYTFTFNNAQSVLAFDNYIYGLKVAYTYASSSYNANAVLFNVTSGMTSFFSAINPVYAILAVLVIILVLVVLVRVVQRPNESSTPSL